MRGEELVFFGWPDLAGLTRGRGLPVTDLGDRMSRGIGWVPCAQAITPFSALAPNPWGPMGDVWLKPDPEAVARVDLWPDQAPFHLMVCDGINPDGSLWEACPRTVLKRALDELESEFGLRVRAAFEQEFYLDGLTDAPEPDYTITAHQAAADFGAVLVAALREARQEPESFEPEGGLAQYEANCRPAVGVAAADRALIIRELTRDVARRFGYRATFTPVIAPHAFGSGVHVHLSLEDEGGAPVAYDGSRPGGVSEIAGRFVAGILRQLPALTAFTAPSPVSYMRLAPQHWSGAATVFGKDNREAAVRICAGRNDPAFDTPAQYNLEFRAADATASPHLTLAVLVRAGLAGLRDELDTPPLVDADPATLSDDEREHLGIRWLPGSLDEALAAAEADAAVSGWLPPTLWQAYLSLKRDEIAGVEGMTQEETIERYRRVY